MTKEELIRNLKYTMKKHENDRVGTFETNISLMCKDILDYLEQEPCGDTIIQVDRLIDLANAIESDDSGYWTNKRISSALRNISFHCIVKKFSPVTQKPIECEDAVSRILKRMWNCRGKHTTSIDKVKMEQIIRDELPSVTRQTGEWIHLRGDMYECSKCRKIYTSFEIGECDAYYCPNCGAKMVEPQESEEKE